MATKEQYARIALRLGTYEARVALQRAIVEEKRAQVISKMLDAGFTSDEIAALDQ